MPELAKSKSHSWLVRSQYPQNSGSVPVEKLVVYPPNDKYMSQYPQNSGSVPAIVKSNFPKPFTLESQYPQNSGSVPEYSETIRRSSNHEGRNTLKTAGQCQHYLSQVLSTFLCRNTLKTAGQCQSLDFCDLAANFMFLNVSKFFLKICLLAFIFNVLLQIVKFLQIFTCKKFMQPAKALFPMIN